MSHPSYTSYDEKAAYERRYRSAHNRQSSTSSTSSTSSNSSTSSYRYESESPPRYSYNYYTSADQKPLPDLPSKSRSSRKDGGGEKRVKFATHKPLPPLPLRYGQDGSSREDGGHGRSRSGSGSSHKSAGESAWWAMDFEGKPF